MVKKNVFMGFNFYFFVVQVVLVGFLWGDNRFLYLACLNLLFLGIISLFIKSSRTDTVSHPISMDQIETQEKGQVDISHKIHHIQKPKNRKKVHHFWFFIISILFGFFIWFWLPDWEIHFKLFTTIILAFLLYIIFAGLFKIKPFKTWESFLFIIVLIALAFGVLFNYFNTKLLSNLEGSEDSTYEIENNFVSIDEDIINPETIGESIKDMNEELLDLEQKANFRDVIKYLIVTNQIELQEQKSILFTHVSYSDIDYGYFKTAYDLGMIGKNLNPEKFPLCETYVVMIGLAQNWSVQKSMDIKQSYWNYAKMNELLPSCKYGEVVKFKDLK